LPVRPMMTKGGRMGKLACRSGSAVERGVRPHFAAVPGQEGGGVASHGCNSTPPKAEPGWWHSDGPVLGFRRSRCGGLTTAGRLRRLDELTFIRLRVELCSRCPLRACLALVPPGLGFAPLKRGAPDYEVSRQLVHGALRRTLDCGTYSGRRVWPNVRANPDRGGRRCKPGTR